MTEGCVNYKTVWKDWLIDLFLQPGPHVIPIERMRGFDLDRLDEFMESLSRLEHAGWVQVDFSCGVALTEGAFAKLAVKALRRPEMVADNPYAALVRDVLGDGARDALAEALEGFRKTGDGLLLEQVAFVQAIPVTAEDIRLLEGDADEG